MGNASGLTLETGWVKKERLRDAIWRLNVGKKMIVLSTKNVGVVVLLFFKCRQNLVGELLLEKLGCAGSYDLERCAMFLW